MESSNDDDGVEKNEEKEEDEGGEEIEEDEGDEEKEEDEGGEEKEEDEGGEEKEEDEGDEEKEVDEGDAEVSPAERDLTFFTWTIEDVADWIKNMGFPFYQDCFIQNYVDGKKLIMADATTLCKLGIRDFQHIKTIAYQIRKLIYLEKPDWNRSISLPPRTDWGMFLEMKSKTGKITEEMEFEKFRTDHKDVIWQPPLDNSGKIQTCFREKLVSSQGATMSSESEGQQTTSSASD
ncbi:alpha motif domain-containing 15-like [Octopus vulgaris]|uniref:Alpha motif domain-containing 15-like n=1 Tax=Octopus vulgaris TaxID=6645 RepID=A0AA36BSY8_OCTVU|nr:alpha motif domain-containing 15-like [Octopus vulgaris]